MKFTVKEIEDTPYKTIDLKEHFKEIGDYSEDDEDLLDFYNFEPLLEEEGRILFAIRNNYRADIYTLNLDTFVAINLGSIGGRNISEGDSLSLGAIDMDKVSFEYRINDEENINGLYSIVEKEIVFEFKTSNEYDYLYLTDEYYILLKDPFVWDESKDEWIYDSERDKLYLYDKTEDKKYEIFDRRLKTSYHTSSNHFVHNWGGIDYFLNFPFNMDPEDSEAILKGPKRDEVLNSPKEISFIPLDLFITSVKKEKEISFEILYSWNKKSVIKPYFYENYVLKTLVFSVYDLEKRTIEVLNPIIENGETKIEFIVNADYSHLETCMNIFYTDNETIMAHRDGKTEILTPIYKTIEHRLRETIINANSNGYLVSGWDEDKDGNNYRDYIKLLDIEGKEITRLDGYHLDLKYSKILIRS